MSVQKWGLQIIDQVWEKLQISNDIFSALTANIFESGPMPTPWKFLALPPLGFTSVGVYNRRIIDTYINKTKSYSSEGNLISS